MRRWRGAPRCAMATGRDHVSAARAAPPRMNARMISSVAYADERDRVRAEDRQGLRLRQAFAELSASWWSGRPSRIARIRAMSRAPGVVGMLAASLAVSWPLPVYRKNGAWGRSTRSRLSPGLRPCSGRRPPITTASRHAPIASRAASRAGRPAARMPAWTGPMSYTTRCQARVRPRGRAAGRPPAGRHRAADRRCRG